MCRSDDACNAGFVLMVRTCSNFWMWWDSFAFIFWMRWDSFAFIDRTKEFGKFMWRDDKKELISIFRYVMKDLCKYMKSAMRRHEAHVQKAKFSVKILSTLENA